MADSPDQRGVSPKTTKTFTNKWFFACVLPLFFLVPAMIPGVYWREVKVNMSPSVYTAKSDMWNIHIKGAINLTKKDSVSEIQDIPSMNMVDKTSPIFSEDTPQYGDYFPKKLQKMSQVGKSFLKSVSSMATDNIRGFFDTIGGFISDVPIVGGLIGNLTKRDDKTNAIPTILFSGDTHPNCRLDGKDKKWKNKNANNPKTLTGISSYYNAIIRSDGWENLRKSLIDGAGPVQDLTYAIFGFFFTSQPDRFEFLVNPNGGISNSQPGSRYDDYAINLLQPGSTESSLLSQNLDNVANFLEFECRELRNDNNPLAVKCRQFAQKYIFPRNPEEGQEFGSPGRLSAFFSSFGGDVFNSVFNNVQPANANFDFVSKTYADKKFKPTSYTEFNTNTVRQGGGNVEFYDDFLQIYDTEAKKWKHVCVEAPITAESMTESVGIQYVNALKAAVCQNDLNKAISPSTLVDDIVIGNFPSYYAEDPKAPCYEYTFECDQHPFGKITSNLPDTPEVPFLGGYVGFEELDKCRKVKTSTPRRYVKVECLDIPSYNTTDKFIEHDEVMAQNINQYVRDLSEFVKADSRVDFVDVFIRAFDFVVGGNLVCPPAVKVDRVEECNTLFKDFGSGNFKSCTLNPDISIFTGEIDDNLISRQDMYCEAPLDRVKDSEYTSSCFTRGKDSCPGKFPGKSIYRYRRLTSKSFDSTDDIPSWFEFFNVDDYFTTNSKNYPGTPQLFQDSTGAGPTVRIISEALRAATDLIPAFSQLSDYDFILDSLPLEFFNLNFLRDLDRPVATALFGESLKAAEEFKKAKKWLPQVAAMHEMFTPSRADYTQADIMFFTALENELNDILAALPESTWDPTIRNFYDEAFNEDGSVKFDALVQLNPTFALGYAIVSGNVQGVINSFGESFLGDLSLPMDSLDELLKNSGVDFNTLNQDYCTASETKQACIDSFNRLVDFITQGIQLRTLLNLIPPILLNEETRLALSRPSSLKEDIRYIFLDNYRRSIGLSRYDSPLKKYDRAREFLVPEYEAKYCDEKSSFSINPIVNNFFPNSDSNSYFADLDENFGSTVLRTILSIIKPAIKAGNARLYKILIDLDKTLGADVLSLDYRTIFTNPRYITKLTPIPFEKWPKSQRDRLNYAKIDGADKMALEAAYGAYLALIKLDYQEQWCDMGSSYFNLRTQSATARPRIVQVLMTHVGYSYTQQGVTPTHDGTHDLLAALTSMSYNSAALVLESGYPNSPLPEVNTFGIPDQIRRQMKGYNGQFAKPDAVKMLGRSTVRMMESNSNVELYVNKYNGEAVLAANNPCFQPEFSQRQISPGEYPRLPFEVIDENDLPQENQAQTQIYFSYVDEPDLKTRYQGSGTGDGKAVPSKRPTKTCPPLTLWNEDPLSSQDAIKLGGSFPSKVKCSTLEAGQLYNNLPPCHMAHNQLCFESYVNKTKRGRISSPCFGTEVTDFYQPFFSCVNNDENGVLMPIYYAGSTDEYRSPGICPDFLAQVVTVTQDPERDVCSRAKYFPPRSSGGKTVIVPPDVMFYAAQLSKNFKFDAEVTAKMMPWSPILGSSGGNINEIVFPTCDQLIIKEAAQGFKILFGAQNSAIFYTGPQLCIPYMESRRERNSENTPCNIGKKAHNQLKNLNYTEFTEQYACNLNREAMDFTCSGDNKGTRWATNTNCNKTDFVDILHTFKASRDIVSVQCPKGDEDSSLETYWTHLRTHSLAQGADFNKMLEKGFYVDDHEIAAKFDANYDMWYVKSWNISNEGLNKLNSVSELPQGPPYTGNPSLPIPISPVSCKQKEALQFRLAVDKQSILKYIPEGSTIWDYETNPTTNLGCGVRWPSSDDSDVDKTCAYSDNTLKTMWVLSRFARVVIVKAEVPTSAPTDAPTTPAPTNTPTAPAPTGASTAAPTPAATSPPVRRRSIIGTSDALGGSSTEDYEDRYYCTCREFFCQCKENEVGLGDTAVQMPDGVTYNASFFSQLYEKAVREAEATNTNDEYYVMKQNTLPALAEIYKRFEKGLLPYEGYNVKALKDIMAGPTYSYGESESVEAVFSILADSESPYSCPYHKASEPPTIWELDKDLRAQDLPLSRTTPWKINIAGGFGGYVPFCNDLPPLTGKENQGFTDDYFPYSIPDPTGTIIERFATSVFGVNFNVDEGPSTIQVQLAKEQCEDDSLLSLLYRSASVNDYIFPMIMDYTMDDDVTRKKLGVDFMRCSIQNWDNPDYLKVQNCISELPYRSELPRMLKSVGAENVDQWQEWDMCPTRRDVVSLFIAAVALGGAQFLVGFFFAVFSDDKPSSDKHKKWHMGIYIVHISLAFITSALLFAAMGVWEHADEGFSDYSTNFRLFANSIDKKTAEHVFATYEKAQEVTVHAGVALGWTAAALYLLLGLLFLVGFLYKFMDLSKFRWGKAKRVYKKIGDNVQSTTRSLYF